MRMFLILCAFAALFISVGCEAPTQPPDEADLVFENYAYAAAVQLTTERFARVDLIFPEYNANFVTRKDINTCHVKASFIVDDPGQRVFLYECDVKWLGTDGVLHPRSDDMEDINGWEMIGFHYWM